MAQTFSLWRIFAVLMILFALGSCSTPPRQKRPEVVEIAVTPPAGKSQAERPHVPIKAQAELLSRHETDVLDHKYFVVFYDRRYRLARWVKYELTKEQAAARAAKRRNRFKADPLLSEIGVLAVLPKEYKKTGYDQGHLAPSADFAFSQDANDETFVMSNMVPQKPKLNRVAWRLLEEQVRKWACGEEKITVITGPILEEDLDQLPGGVRIPQDFFKIVFDETPPRKAIAFVYHQTDTINVMKNRIVSLKELDERIGENFSSYLENEERRPAQSIEWKECVP